MQITASARRVGREWQLHVEGVDGVVARVERIDDAWEAVAVAVGRLHRVDPAVVQVDLCSLSGGRRLTD